MFWSLGLAVVLLLGTVFRVLREPSSKGEPPAAFPFGLVSSSSPAEVSTVLNTPGPPELVSEERFPSGWWGPCPRHEQKKYAYPDRQVFGVEGKLLATFLNDRLFRLEFEGHDPTLFFSEFRRQQERVLGEGSPFAPSTNVQAWGRAGSLVWDDNRISGQALHRFWFCVPRSLRFRV